MNENPTRDRLTNLLVSSAKFLKLRGRGNEYFRAAWYAAAMDDGMVRPEIVPTPKEAALMAFDAALHICEVEEIARTDLAARFNVLGEDGSSKTEDDRTADERLCQSVLIYRAAVFCSTRRG